MSVPPSRDLTLSFVRELVEQSRVPMFVIRPDLAFRFVYANDAACAHFGRAREQLLRVTIIDVDPNATPDGCERFWERVRAERAVAFETIHHQLGGATVPVELHASAIIADGVELIAVHAFDLSERQAKAKLDAEYLEGRRLESLAKMASSVAHDFNNLLVGILANIAHASEVIDDPAVQQVLDEAEASARDAGDLCRQLLAYAGTGRFVSEVVPLSDVLEACRPALVEAAGAAHVVDLQVPKGLPPAAVQVQQIRQLLVNLVRNASEALGQRSGTIRVMCTTEALEDGDLSQLRVGPETRPGTFARIEVVDDGPGIDEAIQDRIFEPFFSTRRVGRGLGLAAVLGVVQGHGGAVAISSARGAGTRVRVWLPVTTPRAPEVPAARPETGRQVVLVVDDEPPIRRTVKRILERAGYEVEVAPDGLTAARMVEEGLVPSCVLLDLTMPNLGGRATMERMRKVIPRLPVVLTSGHDDDGGGASAGADPFLPKPFGPTELRDVIAKVLGR